MSFDRASATRPGTSIGEVEEVRDLRPPGVEEEVPGPEAVGEGDVVAVGLGVVAGAEGDVVEDVVPEPLRLALAATDPAPVPGGRLAAETPHHVRLGERGVAVGDREDAPGEGAAPGAEVAQREDRVDLLEARLEAVLPAPPRAVRDRKPADGALREAELGLLAPDADLAVEGRPEAVGHRVVPGPEDDGEAVAKLDLEVPVAVHDDAPPHRHWDGKAQVGGIAPRPSGERSSWTTVRGGAPAGTRAASARNVVSTGPSRAPILAQASGRGQVLNLAQDPRPDPRSSARPQCYHSRLTGERSPRPRIRGPPGRSSSE